MRRGGVRRHPRPDRSGIRRRRAGALSRPVESFEFPQVGRVTVSVGFTRVVPGDNPLTAFGRADEALYIAKEQGRNRVLCYETLVARRRPARQDVGGGRDRDVLKRAPLLSRSDAKREKMRAPRHRTMRRPWSRYVTSRLARHLEFEAALSSRAARPRPNPPGMSRPRPRRPVGRAGIPIRRACRARPRRAGSRAGRRRGKL